MTSELVRRIYRDVVKREPDAGGLAFWIAHLDQGHSCETLFHLLWAEKNKPAPIPTPIPSGDLDVPNGVHRDFYPNQPQSFTFRVEPGTTAVELAVTGVAQFHRVLEGMTGPGVSEPVTEKQHGGNHPLWRYTLVAPAPGLWTWTVGFVDLLPASGVRMHVRR